ncbi:hypothetical protein HM1_0422 [Heliomicrobium modesticaldum Ice1]|uniref:Uncharacterized protein n=1 Tax=Heliobacterium modesticaldum (strain ATCC 51547 / Ice1) TaxID=498761 RepID=B0TFE0_HELMI|nr:hypothetical protein [Heliomicrobium modesticaldum]ABZ83039.1 hypothetical protein HM1_0422 [Heliomicrobium modesticaldum Ice1]
MDLSNLKEVLGQLMNQGNINLPIGAEQEKQVKGFIDKVKQKKGLNDAERNQAVQLVSQFTRYLSPEQGKQIKALLDQLMKTQKVSDKDKAALEQIRKML